MMDGRASNGQSTWSDAAVELLKREIALGASSGQIVKRLRSDLRIAVTRNAVIGKVVRLGLERPANGKAATLGRPKGLGYNNNAVKARKLQAELQKTAATVKPAPAVRGVPAVKISAGGHIVKPAPSVPFAPVAAPVVYRPPVTLLDLEAGQCRMVVSDDNAPQPLFCGCRCERGRRGQFESYCVPHQRVTLAGAPRPNTRGAGIPAMGERQPTARFIGRRYNA